MNEEYRGLLEASLLKLFSHSQTNRRIISIGQIIHPKPDGRDQSPLNFHSQAIKNHP